jgi:hypothetical protein
MWFLLLLVFCVPYFDSKIINSSYFWIFLNEIYNQRRFVAQKQYSIIRYNTGPSIAKFIFRVFLIFSEKIHFYHVITHRLCYRGERVNQYTAPQTWTGERYDRINVNVETSFFILRQTFSATNKLHGADYFSKSWRVRLRFLLPIISWSN